MLRRIEGCPFAGGCFWCLEADFDKLPGVTATESGYTAGRTPNTTYHQVSAGGTGHTEKYHQDYYGKNPMRHAYYRRRCGRDARVHEIRGGKQAA